MVLHLKLLFQPELAEKWQFSMVRLLTLSKCNQNNTYLAITDNEHFQLNGNAKLSALHVNRTASTDLIMFHEIRFCFFFLVFSIVRSNYVCRVCLHECVCTRKLWKICAPCLRCQKRRSNHQTYARILVV